jgi:thioesterase domain-containing protein
MTNYETPDMRGLESLARCGCASEVDSAGSSAIVPLRAGGRKPPLFLVHGVDGTLEPFRDLVRHMEPDQPIYGVRSQALLGEATALLSVEELAAYYIQTIQAVYPRGPYHLLGFSFGGLVAFEMARQLHNRGELVGMLGLVDNLRMRPRTKAEGGAPIQNTSRQVRKLATGHLARFLSARGLLHVKETLVARSLRTIYTVLRACRRPVPRFLRRAYDINWFAAVNYVPQFYPGRVTLFPAAANNPDASNNDLWARLAGGGIKSHSIPGRHEDILAEPHVITLAKILTDCVARETNEPNELHSRLISH